MTRGPNSKSVTFTAILHEIMEDQGLDMHTLACRCGVTYQTIKNVINGGSVSRRFISQLIRQFGIEKNPLLLRRVLIAFLRVQFDEEGDRLLKAAALLPDSD